MKHLMLCADDYAQNETICAAILFLAKQGRINAISCMMNNDLWHDAHQHLTELTSTHFIGLHLNLTHGQPQSDRWRQQIGNTLPNLSALLAMTYLKRLEYRTAMAEIEAQVAAFTSAMNRYPDFIDGHQHIHQLPIIRDALLTYYKQHQSTSFIRNTSNGWRSLLEIRNFPKSQLIALLGGITFRRRLAKQAVSTNRSFAGIYQYRYAEHYRDYFKHFLSQSQDEGLIMCHPGQLSTDQQDPLYRYRHHELNYLSSEAFLQDLTDYDFQLKHKATT